MSAHLPAALQANPQSGPLIQPALDPPANLAPDSFAGRLYYMLAPVAQLDPTVGWSLLIYLNGLGVMFQLLDDVVRDSPEGPGWSVLMDLDRCPASALPWLAQFVGVRIPAGLTEAQQRAWAGSTDGFKRGTRQAMVGAAAATLTGDKTVVFRERSGDPAVKPEYAYFLDVSTYDSQTPNPTATLAALTAQKPGGIILRYAHHPGQDYQSLKDGNASYAVVKTKYPSYDAARLATPG